MRKYTFETKTPFSDHRVKVTVKARNHKEAFHAADAVVQEAPDANERQLRLIAVEVI